MTRKMGLLAALILAGAATAQASVIGTPDAKQTPTDCALSAADLEANAKLSFADFDQRGVTRATARKLGERYCYAQAARAREHWLLWGPDLTERERNVASWHLFQDLASAGDEKAAAHILATTRRSAAEEPDGFDWNTYVVGTWAFLVKDRALLDQMTEKLGQGPGVRNAMNTKVLRRFQTCFDQPYGKAYDSEACAAGK